MFLFSSYTAYDSVANDGVKTILSQSEAGAKRQNNHKVRSHAWLNRNAVFTRS